MFSKQGEGKNKQIFVVNKYLSVGTLFCHYTALNYTITNANEVIQIICTARRMSN